MVATPARLAAFAALACFAFHDAVHGASIELNPVMPTGTDSPITPLNHFHPAFAGKRPKGALEPIIKVDPLQVAIEAETREARLEAARGSASGAGATSAGVHAPGIRTLEEAVTDTDKLSAYYDEPLIVNYNVLQSSYRSSSRVPIPWPGSYWPSYRDGINYRWKSDEASPAEKYARGFSRDVQEIKDAISSTTGILANSDSQPCRTDADCAGLNDGSLCGIREGQTRGYCIPSWYGICHAWAPAALLEPEPLCSVTRKGVTFHPMDIKALVSKIYDNTGIGTVFTGVGFDGSNSPGERDIYGRYLDATRRDIGAGLFHIALTNAMGRFKDAIVMDVDNTNQVWNMPIRSYEVTKMELVDVAVGSQKEFGVTTYPFNAQAKYLVYTTTNIKWVEEAYEDGPLVSTGRVESYTKSKDYTYFLELDKKYNIIGGEWLDRPP
uniref:Elicitor-like transglutaminase n=1 Tax=Globisporangium ultimum (strain ATCC 200006 / CBS 805.95 / DAOM BR144) TaxID=431595 RepID=K3X2H2_GLOUD